jgi:hypothetical protein
MGRPLTPAHYQRPCGLRGAESPYDRHEGPNLPRPRTEAAQEPQGQARARGGSDLSVPAATGHTAMILGGGRIRGALVIVAEPKLLDDVSQLLQSLGNLHKMFG